MKLNGEIVFEHSGYIGRINTSNNVAEYCGLIAVLEFLKEKNCAAIIYGDADMVIKQMNKVWKAGSLSKKELKGKIPPRPRYYLPYYHQAVALVSAQPQNKLQFKWIPREQNTEADELSTRTLRERGYRPDYYQPRETECDRMDAAFEHAITK